MEKGRGKRTDTLQTDNVFTHKEYIEREAAKREELIKTLRLRAAIWEKMYDEDGVLKQAADAIEELQDTLGRKEHFDSLTEQNCKQPPSVRGVIVSANHGITYVGYDEPKPQQPKEEKYGMNVELLEYPTEKDWMKVKRRALVTIGKRPISTPTEE